MVIHIGAVMVGEERNIFPYQGNAQLFFNSSLVYELPVLSVYARVLLSEATVPALDEDPNTEEAKDITAEVAELVSSQMQQVAKLKVPLVAEAKWGDSWYGAK